MFPASGISWKNQAAVPTVLVDCLRKRSFALPIQACAKVLLQCFMFLFGDLCSSVIRVLPGLSASLCFVCFCCFPNVLLCYR